MATFESLHDLLETASRSLDEAAGEIRDIPLEPKKENIRCIGDVLVKIFDLQRQIYKVRPELIPFLLWEAREGSDPNPDQIVAGAFQRATTAESTGDFTMAIQILEFLLKTQPTGGHIEQTRNEITRLKKSQDSS